MPSIKPRVPILQRGHPLGNAVGWYSLGGPRADDAARNIGPGTLAGGASFVRNALSLNGTSGYVDLGTPSAVNFGTADFAILTRFRTNTVTASKRMMLVGKDDASLGRQFSLQINGSLDASTQGNLRFDFWFGGVPNSLDTPANLVVAGRWHTVFAVRRGTTTEIWLDGVRRAVQTVGAASLTGSTAPLNLGRRSYSGFSDYFEGDIDAAAFLRGAPSPGAIADFHADPYAAITPTRSQVVYFSGLGGGGPATATGSLSATLGAITLGSTATAATPATATGTLARTLGAVTLTGTATAATPTTATGTLSLTLGTVTLSSGATAATPGASTANLTSALGAVTLASAATSTAPANATGALTTTLGAITLSSTATASAAGAITGTLAKTLGSISLTSTATSGAASAATATLAATLGVVTLTSSATASAAGAITGSLTATLGSIALTSTATAGTASAATGSLVVTLGTVTLASGVVADTPVSLGATGSLVVTLGSITLSGSATTTTPTDATGSLDATLGAITLIATAGSPVISVMGPTYFTADIEPLTEDASTPFFFFVDVEPL